MISYVAFLFFFFNSEMFESTDDNLSTPLTISYPSNIGNLLGEGLRIAELVRKERGSYFVCQ